MCLTLCKLPCWSARQPHAASYRNVGRRTRWTVWKPKQVKLRVISSQAFKEIWLKVQRLSRKGVAHEKRGRSASIHRIRDDDWIWYSPPLLVTLGQCVIDLSQVRVLPPEHKTKVSQYTVLGSFLFYLGGGTRKTEVAKPGVARDRVRVVKFSARKYSWPSPAAGAP